MLIDQGQLYVLNVDVLREKIIEEDHGTRYFIHPKATKIQNDIWDVYCWSGMKKDITGFVGKCLNCKQGKAEHEGR